MRRTALRVSSCGLAAAVTVLMSAPAASGAPKHTDLSDRKVQESDTAPAPSGRKLG